MERLTALEASNPTVQCERELWALESKPSCIEGQLSCRVHHVERRVASLRAVGVRA
jgi:hypothetical protein